MSNKNHWHALREREKRIAAILVKWCWITSKTMHLQCIKYLIAITAKLKRVLWYFSHLLILYLNFDNIYQAKRVICWEGKLNEARRAGNYIDAKSDIMGIQAGLLYKSDIVGSDVWFNA